MNHRRLQYRSTSRPKVRKRTALVVLAFVLFFGVLVSRVFFLHVVPDARLTRLARTQYQTALPQVTPRGNIFDSAGELLALSVPSVSLAVRPKKIAAPAELTRRLSRALSLPEREVSAKLKSGKKYVWIKRQFPSSEASALKKFEDPGLEWVNEPRRYYPNRELSSQILGAVGIDGRPLGGIELAYDSILRGKSAAPVTYRDARGTQFEMPDSLEVEDDPHDLWLTLNRSIQFTLESELEGVCRATSAKSCTGIVMDSKTGAILAMASVPSFNPNAFQDYDWRLWKNRAVTDGFEPGSIFKVILAIAALESGRVDPGDRFFCENGSLKIGRHVIHDHEPHGMLSFRDILKVSSNIGFYKVGQRVGKEEFWRVIDSFGFGKKTGIDFPGEEGGFVRKASDWKEIEFATISFGQGVRVTPLQMARAFSVIASGGYDVKPHFAEKVTRPSGEVVWRAAPRFHRVLKESTVAVLTKLLTDVTEEGGTGIQARIPGFRVAGKTGTAQKVKGKGYSHTDFMSSFVGFAPAENPRVTALIVVDEPRGTIYGGAVAAPVFSKVVWTALRELGVAPQGGDSSPRPNWVEAGLRPLGGGWGLPRTESTGLPDFRGLSFREVLSLLETGKIPAELVGSGVAFRQDPPAGTVLKGGEICRISFRSLP